MSKDVKPYENPNDRAEVLKREGNELQLKGYYKEAYRRYSEALKFDPQNPVYYANRAASSQALYQYLDASSDATEATKLNPKYAKAWARLGKATYALEAWSASVEAWKKALDCLPHSHDHLTDTESRLKSHFDQGLKKAEEMMTRPPELLDVDRIVERRQPGPGDMPWDRARAIIRSNAGTISSALSILPAYQEITSGIERVKRLKSTTTPNGELACSIEHGALRDLTNGLMRDQRAFYLDSPGWLKTCQMQIQMECQLMNAWTTGGAKYVTDQAAKKLRREGWTNTRPSLTITIRLWIMNAFFATGGGKLLVAAELYSRVVEVLDWGSRLWDDVPKEDRGAIFERTFIRGVKRLRIFAIQAVLSGNVAGCQYTKDELAELCRDLLAETNLHPPPPETVLAWYLSFWQYPKAEAYASLGWYHQQRAIAATKKKLAFREYAETVDHYCQAAEALPDDDEKCTYFLAVAVEVSWDSSKPLKDIMPLVARVSFSFTKARQIWEHSAGSEHRLEHVEKVLSFGIKCKKAIDEGVMSLDSVVKPISRKPQDKWGNSTIIYI